MDETKVKNGKVLKGVVVSDSMEDTAVVLVKRHDKHPKYKKYITKTKKYKVHDKGNKKKVGDKVKIIETKPISKDKRFKILE